MEVPVRLRYYMLPAWASPDHLSNLVIDHMTHANHPYIQEVSTQGVNY